MTRADHGHLTTYSRRIVDLFENPTPQKKISSQKKIRKRGLENEFSFWEGLPVGAMLVFGSAPKNIL